LIKRLFFLLIIVFLHACQTHLPVVSEMEETDSKPCLKNIEQLELADIDYLLYANRMVDEMIQDKQVQQKLSINRLRLLVQPVHYASNNAKVDMDTINTAIKNRLRRSGHFVIVSDEQLANAQLLSAFETKTVQTDHCVENYEQFSMQLKNSRTGQLIWSDKKLFK